MLFRSPLLLSSSPPILLCPPHTLPPLTLPLSPSLTLDPLTLLPSRSPSSHSSPLSLSILSLYSTLTLHPLPLPPSHSPSLLLPILSLYSILSSCIFPFSFNQLDLPAYETFDKLRKMLLLVINECSEGFGPA